MKKTIAIALLVCLFLPFAVHSADGDIKDFPYFNSQVNSITVTAGEMYIGGDFSRIYYYTPYRALIDNTTGDYINGFPQPNTQLSAICADGNGGWFIGGGFSKAGNTDINRLAHILSDGTVDPSWNPNPSSDILAIKISGNTLIVMGYFNTISGINSPYIAFYDKNTLAIKPVSLNFSSNFYTMDADGNTLYVSGYFSSANSQPRNRFAAIYIPDGTLLPWAPALTNGDYAYAIEAKGNTVYVGGSFSEINSVARNQFAAIDNTGALYPMTLNVNSSILKLEASGNTLFVAGYFTTIEAQNRQYIGAIDRNTGAVLPWNPGSNSNVYDIEARGNTLYVGGYFNNFNQLGVSRYRLAAFDTDSGALLPWTPLFDNGGVSCLDQQGNRVLAGGDIYSAKGRLSNYFVSLNPDTGEMLPWDPAPDSSVRSIAVAGNTICVMGYFNNITNTAKYGFAAFDKNTKALLPLDLSLNGPIYGSDVKGNTLYITGGFSNVMGASRNNAAAIDLASGTLLPWDPSMDGTGMCVKAGQDRVFIAGNFNNVNYSTSVVAMPFVAAFDDVSGTAIASWNPQPDNYVNSIDLYNGLVYMGGDFLNLGLTPKKYAAALNQQTGAISGWAPVFDNSVRTVMAGYAGIYTSGYFGIVDGLTRDYYARVDASTGAVNGPRIIFDSYSNCLSEYGNTLFCGGNSYYINGLYNHRYFAAIEIQGAPTPGPVTTPTLVPVNRAMLQRNLANISNGESILIRVPAYVNGTTARISIYSRQGSLVKKIEKLLDGSPVAWDGKNDGGDKCGAGVYIIRIEAGSVKETLKAVIVK